MKRAFAVYSVAVCLFLADIGLVLADSPDKLLIGNWKLVSVEGEQPPNFLRKVLVLSKDRDILSVEEPDFNANKSSLEKLITKALAKGTWHVTDGRLFASNSPNKEGAPFRIEGNKLHFDGDPYIRTPDVPAKTTYEKVVSAKKLGIEPKR